MLGPAPGVEFAGPGARLVAYIVDTFIQTGATLALVLAGVAFAVSVPLLVVVCILGWLVMIVGYFPYFWSTSGQTPGMKMLRIKVVRDLDGGPVSIGQAILRLIGYWVSSAVFYLGFIWIFVDRRRRGWMDLIAGTVVISAP